MLCVLLEDAWRFLLCFVFFLLEFWVLFPDLVQETINCPRRNSYDLSQIYWIVNITRSRTWDFPFSHTSSHTQESLLFSCDWRTNSFYWIFFYILACADFLSHMSRCYKPPQPISECCHHHDGDSSNWCNFLPIFQFHFLQCFWVILQHWLTCFLQCRSWNLL